MNCKILSIPLLQCRYVADVSDPEVKLRWGNERSCNDTLTPLEGRHLLHKSTLNQLVLLKLTHFTSCVCNKTTNLICIYCSNNDSILIFFAIKHHKINRGFITAKSRKHVFYWLIFVKAYFLPHTKKLPLFYL